MSSAEELVDPARPDLLQACFGRRAASRGSTGTCCSSSGRASNRLRSGWGGSLFEASIFLAGSSGAAWCDCGVQITDHGANRGSFSTAEHAFSVLVSGQAPGSPLLAIQLDTAEEAERRVPRL